VRHFEIETGRPTGTVVHIDEALRERLGLADDELASLRAAKVI
jgi:hypothetical protein